MLKILRYVFVFLLACSAPAFSQDLGRIARFDAVLASVNGDPITLLDVLFEGGSQETMLGAKYSGSRLFSEIEKYRKEIVEEIIFRKLVFEIYKKNPFKIDKQYIEEMLDTLSVNLCDSTRPGLEKKAREEWGITMDQLREMALEKLAVDAIIYDYCDRSIHVTPKEIYDSYKENLETKWSKPAMIDLQIIQILKSGGRFGEKSEEAMEHLTKLFKDADVENNPDVFGRAVADYSDAYNAERKGVTGMIALSTLRPEFLEALDERKEGKIVGPIDAKDGYFFLRVTKLEDPKETPFKDVSEEIKKELYAKVMKERRLEYSEKLKQKALIRYYFD